MPKYLSATVPGQAQITHDPTVTLEGDPMGILGDNPFLDMTEAILFGAVNTLLGWIDDATGLDLLSFALALEGLLGGPLDLMTGFLGFLTPGGSTAGGGVFGPLLGLIPGLGGGTGTLGGLGDFLNPATLLTGGGIFGPLLELIPGLGGGAGTLGGLGDFLNPAALLTGGGLFGPLLDLIPGLSSGSSSLLDFGDFLNPATLLTGGGIFGPLLELIPGLGGGAGTLGGLGDFLNPASLLTGGGIFGPLLDLIPGLSSGSSSLLDFGNFLNPASLLTGGGIFGPLLDLIPGLSSGTSSLGDFGDWLNPTSLLTGGGIFGPLLDQLPGISNLFDFGDFLNNIPGLSQFLDWFGLDPGGDATTLQDWATGILTGFSPLDASNLFNFGNFFGKVPIGNLTSESQELLDNPDFREAISLQGGGVWTWDGAVGRTVPGSAKVTANGIQNVLVSNTIAVGQGDKLHPAIFAKWTGLTYTGTKPVRLEVVRLLYDSASQSFATMGYDEIAAPASPVGTQGAWFLLSADYTVPSNVSHIALRLVVDANATAGDVWFDDASCMKTGLIEIPWVSGLPTQLGDLVQTGKDILNNIFGGIFGALPDGDVLPLDIFDALQAIPPANVLGLQGGTIVDTFTGTIDTLWGGFAQLFGSSGKSVFDVASLASDTVSTAQTGLEVSEWNNAILGFRAGESLFSGLSKTEVSNFSDDRLVNQGAADPVTLNAAAGFTPMAFYVAKQSDLRGVIHWHGKGFTNVTSLFIDLYRFNYTTNQLEWFHTSPNQVGIVGSGWGSLKYVMAEADRFQLNQGDVIAVGWRVVGTGTHSIAGIQYGTWYGNDTSTIPSRKAAIRTDSAATTATFATLLGWYSNNVPWLGLDIVTGDTVPDYHAPRTTQFTTAGAFSYTPPDWADEVDEFLCSGGGGGQGGDPAIFQTGGGGRKGVWSTRTLVRGTDFATSQTFTGTVGAGGGAGSWPAQDGENGSATTRSAISGGNAVHTAAGGLGGRDMASDKNGEAAGTSPVVSGNSFPGGGTASHGKPGAAGQSPGGGGGGGDGGTWGVAWNGGPGARGAVIYVARQVD